MSYEKLNRAIESGLFCREMCEIVTPPSLAEISRFANSLGIKLSEEHIELLAQWGGSNLDEIRINGLDQVVFDNSYIEFASDYNGIKYKYGVNGAVVAIDTDGGQLTQLAASVSDFINNILLGEAGQPFYGADWVSELIEHGIA